MNIVGRFVLSRDFGWKLNDEEFAEAVISIVEQDDAYVVIDRGGRYLVNKNYVKVTVKRGTDVQTSENNG